ncbi:MAG: NUDIX hydrolase [Gammaproteobacteria bacterium]|nr:MAG: NUDIX hydrolase [Gammaproteobacteria bacterium]
MIWKPHVTVAAVIESSGRFLLVRERIDGTSVYNQPAGHLEEGESLVTAVIRETLEETAWHFEPESIVGLYRWQHPDKDKTYLRVTFSGSAIRHDANRPLDPDIEEVVWMSAAGIRRESVRLRSPMVLRSVEDFLSGSRYPLSLLSDIAE